MPRECSTCHAEIDWATIPPLMQTDGPHPIPFDHDSAGDPAGTFELWRDNGGTLRYKPLKQGEVPTRGKRGVSHFVTCPDRAEHRTKGK